jgi:hypothetical protein
MPAQNAINQAGIKSTKTSAGWTLQETGAVSWMDKRKYEEARKRKDFKECMKRAREEEKEREERERGR